MGEIVCNCGGGPVPGEPHHIWCDVIRAEDAVKMLKSVHRASGNAEAANDLNHAAFASRVSKLVEEHCHKYGEVPDWLLVNPVTAANEGLANDGWCKTPGGHKLVVKHDIHVAIGDAHVCSPPKLEKRFGYAPGYNVNVKLGGDDAKTPAEASALRIKSLRALLDETDQVRNRLSDECGRLADENRDLLADNARLRREIERMGRKR